MPQIFHLVYSAHDYILRKIVFFEILKSTRMILAFMYVYQVNSCMVATTVECNNFASSLMSQNCPHWNLDFFFPWEPFSKKCIIKRYIVEKEHKLALHLFEQK